MFEKDIADGILSPNLFSSEASMMVIFGEKNGAKIIKVKQPGGEELWTPNPLYYYYYYLLISPSHRLLEL